MFSSAQPILQQAANAVINNPLVNPYGFLGSQISSFLNSGAGNKGQAPQRAAKPKAPPVEPTQDPNDPNFLPPPPPDPSTLGPGDYSLPYQQEPPQGSAGFGGLPGLLGGALERSFDLQEKLSSAPYLRELSDINIATYAAQSEIAQQAAMEKSRENTARQIELQNLRSWEAITRAEIDRERAMAQALMSTAYIAGTPNANVLSALSGPVSAAIQAFQPGKSVF
jgi:hypothetical protein